MNSLVHFHTADLQSVFHIIGSADRDLLAQIGVNLGEEFAAPLETAPDEVFEEEEPDEEANPDWELEEEAADSAKAILTKMIMSGLPHDLAEDEAYAVQNFLAAQVLSSGGAQAVEPDDLLEDTYPAPAPELADQIRRALLEGVDTDLFDDLLDFLREHNASHDLSVRVQMLCLGRLPDSEEPTFTDLEDEAYSARFGYLASEEAAGVADELDELLEKAPAGLGCLPHLLSMLFAYCNSQSTDLVVTIEEA